MRRTLAVILLALALTARGVLAQRPDPTQRSMEGPRIGVTYVSGGRPEDFLRDRGLNRLMTQFGWHSEQEVFPAGRGPAFVVQEVMLVGGVEQQAFLPSVTLLMGIRTPGGFELGIGPNLSLGGSALTVAIGKSLHYGGVSLPIDLAVTSVQGSVRTTILLGYAIQSSN
jgi:hypothetical protein